MLCDQMFVRVGAISPLCCHQDWGRYLKNTTTTTTNRGRHTDSPKWHLQIPQDAAKRPQSQKTPQPAAGRQGDKPPADHHQWPRTSLMVVGWSGQWSVKLHPVVFMQTQTFSSNWRNLEVSKWVWSSSQCYWRPTWRLQTKYLVTHREF